MIEDAAQSLGSRIGSKSAGTFGDSAMFSFCQNKAVTTGEGGVVVTDSRDIYEKLKLLVSHGRPENTDYFGSGAFADYIALGYNFRMPTMCAALGISQLGKAKELAGMRQSKANYYTKELAETNNIIPPMPPDDFFHVYQMYTIQVQNGLRDELKAYLDKEGISTRVYFDPIHLFKYYRDSFGYSKGYLPVTEDISKRVLTLPMFAKLSKDEMDHVINSIKNFMEEH